MQTVRWKVLVVLLVCLGTGCGARARAAVEEELVALEGDIAGINDDASAEAFGNKGEALGRKINALALADRKAPGDRLRRLFDQATAHYGRILEADKRPAIKALELIMQRRPIIYESEQPIGPAYH